MNKEHLFQRFIHAVVESTYQRGTSVRELATLWGCNKNVANELLQKMLYYGWIKQYLFRGPYVIPNAYDLLQELVVSDDITIEITITHTMVHVQYKEIEKATLYGFFLK